MSQHDWQQIETEACLLRGDGGFIELLANSVLLAEDRAGSPAALGFQTKVCVENLHGSTPIEISCAHGFYGSLNQVIDEFRALRSGAATSASLSMIGLQIRVFENERGPRSALCVTVDVSSISHEKHFPWPIDIGEWLAVERSATFHFRCAFVSHLVDPPFVDQFLSELIRLQEAINPL